MSRCQRLFPSKIILHIELGQDLLEKPTPRRAYNQLCLYRVRQSENAPEELEDVVMSGIDSTLHENDVVTEETPRARITAIVYNSGRLVSRAWDMHTLLGFIYAT